MKKIRLEIPLEVWKELPSNRMWLRVDEDHTEAFQDRELMLPIPKEEKNVVQYLSVPKELSLIEVIGYPGWGTLMKHIQMDWEKKQAEPNGKVVGLKKVTILTKHTTYDIPIVAEGPDIDALELLEEKLWSLNWMMEVDTWEDRTIASFHWYPNLIRDAEKQVLPICFTKIKHSPCIFERGGYSKRKGKAIIVCNKEGTRKKPLYTAKRPINSPGKLLVRIKEGDIIIRLEYNKAKAEGFIAIWQIKEIHKNFGEMEVEIVSFHVYNFANNSKGATIHQWKNEVMRTFSRNNEADVFFKYHDAILAAFEKASNSYVH